jgi:acyl carrier protein
MSKDAIVKKVSDYISDHVFSGKLPSDFTNDTPMVSTRLVNSIAVLHMVNHFEEEFKVEFEAHEISVDNLDTVNLFADFIASKVNA